ncbi:hypothetical protein HHL11_02840 [Ramlibacter sp. G-1-2-2]|uniref:Uncharacterized protein n=1 Tax=Ramlibacter agri TaxID=2728837 RepID=A0A848GZ56_9BURK|nr:hypothetical protein [Ramlibacter agri]NML42671.1 hypothetical protein [Ramlibacter agri]
MTAFEIVALTGALAGISMVLGGIWLVAKGVITLAATPKRDAITIEWKKQFRINTQVPGIAFFLVGLLFITMSLGFLKPPDIVPIEFDGEIKGIDDPPAILVRPANWELPSSTGGRINGRVYPDLSVVVLMINAPGYEPYTQSIRINPRGRRVAHVGTLELRRKVQESDLEKRIAVLPFTTPATEGGFGVAQ